MRVRLLQGMLHGAPCHTKDWRRAIPKHTFVIRNMQPKYARKRAPQLIKESATPISAKSAAGPRQGGRTAAQEDQEEIGSDVGGGVD